MVSVRGKFGVESVLKCWKEPGELIKQFSQNVTGLTRPSSAADKRVYRPAGDVLVAARPDEEMGMFLSFMGPRL
ncbi:hypothetical protein GPALN_004608 [Globodera pallida]|nr:hypothetical protein GPALN_004608 [Globodera pallida]